MPPIFPYYTNLEIGDYLGPTAVWHMAALLFVILASMQFIVIAEHATVGYESCDLPMDLHSCSLITLISSGAQRRVDH